MYKLSANGLDLIKRFEGCRLTAYKCVSTEKYYTIGYGHYDADVVKGSIITTQQAEDLLVKDAQKYVDIVNKYVDKYSLSWMNQNRFDALVSFTYNCGEGNLKKLLASGARNEKEVSNAILLYTKSGGVELPGLVKRRKAEKQLFDNMSTVDIDSIAREVIAGKWGNGAIRRIKLTNAGFNYNEVQKRVNELLRR